MGKHWSNEDLINRLYEAGGGDEEHLTGCAECRERWEALLVRRRQVLAAPEVPAELLAEQRRQIHRRMGERRAGFWSLRLAPALAALAVVFMGITLISPTPEPEPATFASNEDTFFTEIYTMLESPEPAAIAPLHSLFEE